MPRTTHANRAPLPPTRGAAISRALDRCNTAADGCRLELGAAWGTKAIDGKRKCAREARPQNRTNVQTLRTARTRHSTEQSLERPGEQQRAPRTNKNNEQAHRRRDGLATVLW